LASLYYDTQDYRFYREKIEGLKFRRKVRIRRYVDEKELKDDSIVFLEIKQRVDRVTQKRRVPMKYVEVLNLIENEIIPDGYQEHDLAVINEVLNMVKTYNLKPSAITTYNRQAFFGKDADI
jgi:SPX domain protein involved in polyphosphate accumulation